MLKKFILIVFTLTVSLLLIMCSSTAKKSQPANSKPKKNETVQPAAVSLDVNPAGVQVMTGGSVELTVKGLDKNGKQAPLKDIPEWKIVSGDKFGALNKTLGEKVTYSAKAAGISGLKVTSGTLAKTITIEVIKPKPEAKSNTGKNIKK